VCSRFSKKSEKDDIIGKDMKKICLDREITNCRFFLSFFPMILIIPLLCIVLTFLPVFLLGLLHLLSPSIRIFFIVGLVIAVELIFQIGVYPFENRKYNKALKDNWKQPKKCSTCEIISIWPEYFRNIYFQFKTIIVEPLFNYHFFYHFTQIKAGWNCVVKYKEFMSEIDHDAIIVNIYSPFGKEYIFGDGIDLLISFFVMREIPFKVYCCNNSIDFFNIINNPKCKTLWLFGHGKRGGIRCSDKYVDYSEIVNEMSIDSKNKNYVYQFHCNSGCDKSLADYLSNGCGFANYQQLDKGREIRGYIENILQDETWQK